MGWVHSYIKVRDSSHYLKDSAYSKALSLQHENACFWNYINLFVGEAHTSAGGAGVEVRGQFTGIILFLPSCGFQKSESAFQSWRQMPYLLCHLTSPKTRAFCSRNTYFRTSVATLDTELPSSDCAGLSSLLHGRRGNNRHTPLHMA